MRERCDDGQWRPSVRGSRDGTLAAEGARAWRVLASGVLWRSWHASPRPPSCRRITRGGDAWASACTRSTRSSPRPGSIGRTVDASLIRRAYETAVAAHRGAASGRGEPYVTHPVAVTYYLATFQMDAETLAAALLHDVPEDTDYTIADLEKAFGGEVATWWMA